MQLNARMVRNQEVITMYECSNRMVQVQNNDDNATYLSWDVMMMQWHGGDGYGSVPKLLKSTSDNPNPTSGSRPWMISESQ